MKISSSSKKLCGGIVNKLFLFFLCALPFTGCAKKEIAQSHNEPAADTQAAVQTQGEAPQQKAEFSLNEITRNPFLTEAENTVPAEAKKTILIDYLSASAILYSERGTSKAIINGQIIETGDSIDNKQVTKIQPETVTLKDDGNEYLVKLRE